MRSARILIACVIAVIAATLIAPAMASADQTTGDVSSGIPPAVDMTRLPGLQPPGPNVEMPAGYHFKQNGQCVGSLRSANLTDIPIGQQWLRIDQAHQYATGKNQTVAVIDTGVNSTSALGNRRLDQIDYLSGVNGVTQADCDGHGTEVAGIIGAQTDTNIGFKGVAPDAKILPIRQSSDIIQLTNDQTSLPAGTLLTLAQAVLTAAQHGAGVINISLAACTTVATTSAQLDQQRVLQAAIHSVVSQGVVVVTAAGNVTGKQDQACGTQNDAADPNKPASIVSPAWFTQDVLSVAAINSGGQDSSILGQPASFSMWGPWVSVAAPGTGIISLDPGSNGLSNQTVENGQAQPIQGTSFAAPYVAGLAALVKEKFPTLNAYQVMNRIKFTAQHPAAPGGRNNQVGYGMIDPIAALTAIVPGEPNSPPPATAQQLPANFAGAGGQNWEPMSIALLGTAVGVVLLLVTLFVVRANQKVQASKHQS